MRLVIQGKELEFRVQERRVVSCSVFHKGKEIAADIAICAPGDAFDLKEGERIAVERVAHQLLERQQAERREAMVKVDKVFTEVGALSGNVELPSLEAPQTILQKVMAKLDVRRDKKAKEAAKLTVERLSELYKRYSSQTGRMGALASLAGFPFDPHKDAQQQEPTPHPSVDPFGPGRAAPPPRHTFLGLPFSFSTRPRGW